MQKGISVWLDVPLEALAERIAAVGTGSRPLLHHETGDAYTKVGHLSYMNGSFNFLIWSGCYMGSVKWVLLTEMSYHLRFPCRRTTVCLCFLKRGVDHMPMQMRGFAWRVCDQIFPLLFMIAVY